MLIGDPLGEGSNASSTNRRVTNHRALGSGELRCSEGSGMLIGDPLDEGSNASSTNNELWRVENLDAQKGAACS